MSIHDFPVIPKDVAAAIKALSSGKANEGQQIRALEWILVDACGIRNLSYQPGDTAATAFAEGRRFAGLLIAGAVQAKPARVPAVKSKPIREAKPDETK